MSSKHELTPEKAKYFAEVDGSILQWSTELGKVELQADSIRGTLRTLYQSRARHLSEAIAEAGISPSLVVSARVDPRTNTLEIELQDQAPPA
jgi:hypothetical protein